MVNSKVARHDLSNPLFPTKTNDNKYKTIRIIIIDDQNVIRQKLNTFLKSGSDLEIVSNIEDGQNAIQQVEALHPDIALINIDMSGIDGLTLIQIVTERFAYTKVIVLSYDTKEYINKALIAGAQGYLPKTTPAEEIIQVIRFVHKGYLQ